MPSIGFGKLFNDAGKLLPEGWYDVVFVKADVTESTTGKPMIKAMCRLEGGNRNGQSLFTQFTVSAESQGALRIFFQQMTAFGMDGAFWARDPELEEVAENIKGKRAKVEVQHREWQGVTREGVKGIRPPELTGPIDPALLAVSNSGGNSKPVAPAVPATPGGPTSAPPTPSF